MKVKIQTLHVNFYCEIARTESLQLLIAFKTPLRGSLKFVSCILIIKPTRCTNFSNLFLEYYSTCFEQVFCSIIRSLVLYTQQKVYYVIQVTLTAC